MSPVIPILLALALGLVGWLAARGKAWSMRRAARAAGSDLHSLPGYHGWYVALWILVPALLFAIAWASISPGLVLSQVLADPAAAKLPAFGFQREAILAEARAIASGSSDAVFNQQARAMVEPFRAAMQRYSVIGAVVGELVGSDRGLGFLINVGRGQYDTALVFVGVLTLVCLAVLLYSLVVWLEKRLLRWKLD